MPRQTSNFCSNHSLQVVKQLLSQHEETLTFKRGELGEELLINYYQKDKVARDIAEGLYGVIFKKAGKGEHR